MVALSILGLQWCPHAGWHLALYDTASRRRLQITLHAADAVLLGEELAGRRTERSALYALVGTLLRQQPHLASVTLGMAGPNRASVALVLSTDQGEITCPTSPADGVALALRAGVPIVADEPLLDRFGVGAELEDPAQEQTTGGTPIPDAFRRAMNERIGDR